MPKLVAGLTPDSSGLDLLRAMFRKGFPGCSFGDADQTVIVQPSGREVSWPAIVAATKGKSLIMIANDPSFLSLFDGNVPGKEGAGSFDTATMLGQLFRGVLVSVASNLVPFVPDGTTWNDQNHWWKFADEDGMGYYGGNLPIKSYWGKGGWNAYVSDYNGQFCRSVAAEEADALNQVRLCAYYGPP